MIRRWAVMVFLTVSIFFVWQRSASAQSIWLKEGVSGLGVTAFVSGNDTQTAFGLNLGYSYRGVLDLGLTSAAYIFPDDIGLPEDLVGFGFGPRVEWHPLKQSGVVPISVGVGGFATAFGYASDEYDDADAELRGWNAGFDASIYRFFKLAPNLGITPAASVGFTHFSNTFEERFDETTATDDQVSLALGAYLAILDASGRIWGITPVVVFGEETSLGLQAGLVWTL